MGTFLFEFTAKGPIFMNSCLDMLKGQLMESDFQRDPCCTKKKLPVNCVQSHSSQEACFLVQQRSFWKSICIYCPFNMSKQLFIKIGPFAVNSKRIVPMYFQWDYLRIDAKFTILKYKSPVIIFK